MKIVNKLMKKEFFIIIFLILSMTLLIDFKKLNAQAPLGVHLTTNQATYSPGETVIISVEVTGEVDGFHGVSGADVHVSLVPPPGPAIAFPAVETVPGTGVYIYEYILSSTAVSGTWSLSAHASREPWFTDGSDSTSFEVVGGPSPTYVTDWMIYGPGVSHTNPTTEDFVHCSVWIQIKSTLNPFPQYVDLICIVDAIPIMEDSLEINSLNPFQVDSPVKKYSAGLHTGTWIVDPDIKADNTDRSDNEVNFQFTVAQPAPGFDFTFTTSTHSQTVSAGENALFVITAEHVSGSPESINLHAEGIPPGVSHTLIPNAGTPTFSTTLTIQTTEQASIGTFPITIIGEGAGVSKTISVTLIIESAEESDFELSVVPTEQSVTHQQSINFIVSVIGEGGFDSEVNLAVSGVPSGIQTSFTPTSGVTDLSSTLRLDITEAVEPGVYALTIYASGGGITKSTMIEVEVQKASITETTPSPTTPSDGVSSIWNSLIEQNYLIILLAAVIVILAVALARPRLKSSKSIPQGYPPPGTTKIGFLF
jgi:hypothetical protein